MERLRVDGRFFRLGNERVFLRMVTYGPFPGGWPDSLKADFKKMADAGFNSIRLYQWPDRDLLDKAHDCGLRVFAGHQWQQAKDFLADETFAKAKVDLALRASELHDHPALAGVFVANEVPTDLVRWMGHEKVSHAIESLIETGRDAAPEWLWAYANYPSTEYLEPANADFTAMNVYLEHEHEFRGYLHRLHHIAGDRPLLISEFGIDSQRNGEDKQAKTLVWAIEGAHQLGTAGITIYAWSDRWWNAGEEVTDWSFGLLDREGKEKHAYTAVCDAWHTVSDALLDAPSFSVIVCCRNGVDRIGACLISLESLRVIKPEIIVVDDGSTDGTAELVEADFPDVILIRQQSAGLSAARNAGADLAKGEILAFTDDDCEVDADWLVELTKCFNNGWDAAGGPNLPPIPRDAMEAIIASAPGAASHVMLDDSEAEHVPGCNLAVRRSAYFYINGFDADFRTAGDDVDFCWRLRDAGMKIGFAPNGWVWHHRRPSGTGYLRQQIGYGKAEALLMRKHPHRFSPSGDAIWKGVIYHGSPVRAMDDAVIYHGPMGLAGYQGVVSRMQPLRPLPSKYDTLKNRWLLKSLKWLAPRLRSKARIGKFRGPLGTPPNAPEHPTAEFARTSNDGREGILGQLLSDGWQPGGATDEWDLEKNGTRLLIACEPGNPMPHRILYRVWGNPSILPELDSNTRIAKDV